MAQRASSPGRPLIPAVTDHSPGVVDAEGTALVLDTGQVHSSYHPPIHHIEGVVRDGGRAHVLAVSGGVAAIRLARWTAIIVHPVKDVADVVAQIVDPHRAWIPGAGQRLWLSVHPTN